jgi:hypothetical protein
MQRETEPVARQHLLPNAEIFGAEVSWYPRYVLCTLGQAVKLNFVMMGTPADSTRAAHCNDRDFGNSRLHRRPRSDPVCCRRIFSTISVEIFGNFCYVQ